MTSKPNIDIVIDCHDVELLLDFWAAALGYRKVGGRDQYGLLLPDDPGHPPVLLQRVPDRSQRRPACTSTSASTTSRPKRGSSNDSAPPGSTSASRLMPRSSRWPIRRATSSASAPGCR